MHWNEKGTYVNASWFLSFIPPVPRRFIGIPETGGTPAWFLTLWLLCERLTIKGFPIRLQDSCGFLPHSPLVF